MALRRLFLAACSHRSRPCKVESGLVVSNASRGMTDVPQQPVCEWGTWLSARSGDGRDGRKCPDRLNRRECIRKESSR